MPYIIHLNANLEAAAAMTKTVIYIIYCQNNTLRNVTRNAIINYYLFIINLLIILFILK